MSFVVQVVVPAAAVLMLFALGLTLDGAQMRRLVQHPRGLVVGLASRWIVVPGLAVALCLLARPAPNIALGILLVACCPPATPAPALVRAAGGETALGVGLTAITNLASCVTFPLLFSVGSLLVGLDGSVEGSGLTRVAIRIGALVIVPTVLGMIFRRARPALARRMEPKVTPFAMLLLVPTVVLVVVSSWEMVTPALVQSGPLALTMNLSFLAAAALAARVTRLAPGETVAVLVGSGLFNFGLGAFVSLTLLGDPKVFVPGIACGALMWLTAAGVTGWGRRVALRDRRGSVGTDPAGAR